MHHLVASIGRAHAGFRAVLEADEGFHLGTKRFAVELHRLLAAAVEEQVGLDNVVVLSCGHNVPVTNFVSFHPYNERSGSFKTS